MNPIPRIAVLVLALPSVVSGCAQGPGSVVVETPSLALVDAEACRGREGCVVRERLPAGTNAHGDLVSVVRLALSLDPEGECVPEEFWAVVTPTRGATRAHLVLATCRTAAVEETIEVDVGDGRLSYRYDNGYFSWVGGDVSLDPPRILRHDAMWRRRGDPLRLGSGFTWGFARFAGTIEHEAPLCENDPGAQRACEAMGSFLDEGGPFCTFTRVAVPRVHVAVSYAAEGWRTAAHGRCALHLVAADQGLASSDASVSAMMTSEAMYVNITDDVWSEGDLLQLTIETYASGQPSCVAGEPRVRDVVLRIPSGEVVRGGPIDVSAERRGDRVHLKIVDATSSWEWVGVAYDDRDAGAFTEHTLATSPVQPGERAPGAGIYVLDDEVAACEVLEGALDVVFRERPPSEPLVPASWL